MTQEIDSSAFEAEFETCTFTAGHIDSVGSSDSAHFSDALGRIYVTARALLLSPRPPAGQTQPALTVIVEDSADGSSWATVATFNFAASDQQAAAIDSPRAYLRASWTEVAGVWAINVDVKSLAAPASGGRTLPAQWTVDPDTGTLRLELSLDSSLGDVDAFVVAINSSEAIRVYLGQDGTPLVTIEDLNIGRIWRDEQSDSFPSLQVIDEGEVRSQSLPTVDPGVSGELWVDVAAGRVVKSSAG